MLSWDVPASHVTRSQENSDTHIPYVDILQKDWVSLASSARQNCFPNVEIEILPLSYRMVILRTPNRLSALGRTCKSRDAVLRQLRHSYPLC